MSTIHRTRRPGTGLALAAVLGLGTSFGLMASPALADNGNGNGQSQAPAPAAAAAAPQSSPGQSGQDNGKGGNGNPGNSNPGKGGNGNPGNSNPGKGGNGNPGSSNPGKGNPGKGNQGGGNGGNTPTTGEGATNDPADTPAEGDPAGNNGTIKITPVPHSDGIPQNHPHPGCQFQIEWYGFDADAASPVESTVSFAVQAPTDGDVNVVRGDTSPMVGEDPASGAGTDTGLDWTELYELSFTGTPHPQQGYHVKVTVSTPFANGNDTKSKVFWVSGCETPPVVGETPPILTGTPPVILQNPPAPAPGAVVLGEQATEEEDEVVAAEQNPTVDVLGVEASAPGTNSSASPSAGQVLPTIINAGAAGKDAIARMSQTQAALALLMLLLAAASARLAWNRRTDA